MTQMDGESANEGWQGGNLISAEACVVYGVSSLVG